MNKLKLINTLSTVIMVIISIFIYILTPDTNYSLFLILLGLFIIFTIIIDISDGFIQKKQPKITVKARVTKVGVSSILTRNSHQYALFLTIYGEELYFRITYGTYKILKKEISLI
ncbi:MAG: hypothetical protein FWF57_08540 [Defluviitaleaceae bacterium]|nr:hypothetical protein [Defluviitaleaceae bacterium]